MSAFLKEISRKTSYTTFD